jgi:hypothetical protein
MFDRFQSKKTYLGNSGVGLSVLSIWSCVTLTPAAVQLNGILVFPSVPFPPRVFTDTSVFQDVRTRWHQAFRGGLRMVTGTWHLQPTTGVATLGPNYGTYLKTNTVAEAWRHAAFDAAGTNSAPMVYAYGTSDANCAARLTGMTLNNLNLPAHARLQNAAADAAPSCGQAWW